MADAEQNQIRGHVDGYRDGRIYGWAWRPSTPEEALLIEVLVNGVVVAETAAWMARADLSEAGIGDGRHGFDVPVLLDMERLSETHVVVRVKDGEPLPGALVHDEPDAVAALDPAVAAFVDSILHTETMDRKQSLARSVQPAVVGAIPAVKWQPRDGAAMNFILYCPIEQPTADEVVEPAEPTNTLLARVLRKILRRPRESDVGIPAAGDWKGHRPDHVYPFLASAFHSLLHRLGKVHVARDPINDVNHIYDSCVARDEDCLLLYCALPHQMILGSRCPAMPVIAWDFAEIPTEVWDGDPRNDWRHVLVQTCGAITLSRFAAMAVRKAMGEQFPVVAVSAPVWDRAPTAGIALPMRSPHRSAQLEFQGLVFDSRTRVFNLSDPLPQPPRSSGHAVARSTQITLDGIVFTTVVEPRSGTEDWCQTLNAFVTEFSEAPDVTLVFKMTGRSLHDWWWAFNDLLARLPAFQCRVVALQDFPNDARYAELIASTHWIVNASTSESVGLSALEFMSGGCPAVSLVHTALADFLDTRNAIVVRSQAAFNGWPHDTRQHLTTSSQSVDWASLREALRQAYEITKHDRHRYAAMSEAARTTMQQLCADDVVLETLADFLELRTDSLVGGSKMVPA